MRIPAEKVKELRERTGAGVMECHAALIETEGDMDKAAELLRQRSLTKVEKKKARVASQGLIEAYIHSGGRIGAMVELNCETDFVARTDEFKQLAHDLAMQVTALPPKCIWPEDIPPETSSEDARMTCLLLQPFIKSPDRTIKDLVDQAIAKLGENVKIARFVRYELGEQ